MTNSTQLSDKLHVTSEEGLNHQARCNNICAFKPEKDINDVIDAIEMIW